MRRIYVGPRGGKFVFKGGQKRYLRHKNAPCLQGGYTFYSIDEEMLISILRDAVLAYLKDVVPNDNFCTFDEKKIISYIPDEQLQISLLQPGNDFAIGDYVDCEQLLQQSEQKESFCCCVTASGKRCSRKSVKDSNYCTQHKKAVAANHGKCSKKRLSPRC